MADPLLFPDNQAAAIRSLQERVRTLESTNRLLSSAIKEGRLTVLNGTGGSEIVVGLQDDNHYGLLVGANQPIPGIDIDNVDGMSYPEIPIVWITPPANTVSSSSFSNMADATVPVTSHKGVHLRVQCNTSVGTTGEVRVGRMGGIPATFSDARAVPSDSFLLDLDFYWLHGGVIGQSYLFTVQARKVSGAGTFNVTDPAFAYMVGPEHCSLAGTYVA